MTWEVYGLVDPRDSVVFYVGYSKHGGAHRHGAHCTDRASSAWSRCQDIIESGSNPSVCVFGVFGTKLDARILEGQLILAIPTLVNKKTYHALPPARLGWQKLRIPDGAIVRNGDGSKTYVIARGHILSQAEAKA